MSVEEKIKKLEEMNEKAVLGGGAARIERQHAAGKLEKIARQNQRTHTMHTGSGNGLEGNPVAFYQRFFHATFAAHPQRLHVRDLRREYVVNGEGGVHSSARSPGANQQPHRMTSSRFLPS